MGEYASLLRLDKRLKAILDDVRVAHGLRSLLLADRKGLAVSHVGDIADAGVAAIAPEFLRVGERAVRLGGYGDMSCVAMVLENSHLMIIRDIELRGEPFVLVMETTSVPKGLGRVIRDLAARLERAMND